MTAKCILRLTDEERMKINDARSKLKPVCLRIKM